MSSSRPSQATRPLRPTMHADLPNRWLWCNDNAKVTKWHMNLVNRPAYAPFISSFINHANRTWEKGIDAQSKLSPLDRDIIDCLLEEPLSADTMIEILDKYNGFVGGGHGGLKQVGLITWLDETPKDAAIKKGAEQLHELIKKTVLKYHEAEATRAAAKGKGKGVSKNKGKGKAVAQVDEDEEMQDAPIEDEQTMPSLEDMEVELINAGNTASAVDSKGKGKLQNSVKFGELPYVGNKKRESQGKKENKDEEDEEEWKKFFLGT